MSPTPFDNFLLNNMPHFIAINYQQVLAAQTSQEQVKKILRTYDLGLRAFTISLVSQYLTRDSEQVSDPYLNELLLQKFPHLTLDAWQQLLFALLKAYEGKRDLFFMPELYDFYWDTSTVPHRRRVEVERPFERLTQITLELLRPNHKQPQNETEWAKLAAETKELFQQVVQYWRFVDQYDLIRVLYYDESIYDFELHKGLRVSTERRPLPGYTKFTPGWFYLRKETEDFLLLHPFLVFWEEETEEKILAITDTGVYDRFVYEQMQYLLSTLGRTIINTNSVKTFITVFYDTLEEIKRQRHEADKLTWWQLSDICADINRQRMATIQNKYRRELYLQREKTCQAFEEFLKSEKHCFVLIGKSGVGKSNFMLALSEQLQSRSDTCVLMYDGAPLKIELSLTSIINKDFDDRLILSGRQIQDIWREIARIDGIENHLVVLWVDAINENSQAKELLRQLDELAQRPWPWLKVVFSSRPETWQAIKRGVRLAETLYFRETGAEGLGVELEPFSYSQQMEPFSKDELPQVYTKHQEIFKLQTKYENLKSELREILKDPLSLWLVAKTYEGQPIPSLLKLTELIEHYLKALIKSERLRQEDLRFLEKQLMPLMIREGWYSNALTGADIDAAGDGLYELIYSEQVLSDGQRMNQSFANLLDAEILARQGEGRDQKIAFKYERFYEYFAGQRILELSRNQPDRKVFYSNLVGKITESPFLWGAIKNALIQEAKGDGHNLVTQLCFTDQQRVKEMMVGVLIDFGRDNPAQIEQILKTLIPPEEKAGRIQILKQLIAKPPVDSDISSRNAQKIAIEAASHLGILWVLQLAALQPDPTIRTAVVRYSYHLWQHDPDKGFQLLENLAQKAIPGLIPHLAAFESTLGLSLTIFFDHSRDEPILTKLQTIWRSMIARMVGVKETSRRRRLFRKFIIERVFSVAITVILRLMSELPKYNIINYPDLEKFFRLGATEKVLYTNLLQYLDVQRSYSQEQIEHDFLAVLETRDLFIQGVTTLALAAKTIQNPQSLLPFLKKFFNQAQADPLPTPWLRCVPDVLLFVLHRDPMQDESFDFFVQTVEICQEYYAKYPQLPGVNYVYYAPRTTYLGTYIPIQYQRTNFIQTDWLKSKIEAALARNDLPFFELLLQAEMPLVGIELRQPQSALDALALFFNHPNKEIQRMVGSFLARLRVHYPDEVDVFLEEQKVSEEFELQIQTSEPNETVGELIGIRSWYFVQEDVIGGSPELRSQLVRLFAKAAECKNMRSWLDYLLREIINLIYGEKVL